MDAAPRLAFRPFEPGEKVDNGDGTHSTERTRTVRLPTGEWVNVPSLWMGPAGPADLNPMSDDFLGEFATRYEQQAGPKWPRFKSVDEAVAAAKARSNAGGAAAGRPRR